MSFLSNSSAPHPDDYEYAHYLMVSEFDVYVYHKLNFEIKTSEVKKMRRRLMRTNTVRKEYRSLDNNKVVFEQGMVMSMSLNNKKKTTWCTFTFIPEKISGYQIFMSIKSYISNDPNNKNTVHIVGSSNMGLYLIDFDVITQSTDISLNYNEDTLVDYAFLKSSLAENKESLVIFHSEPGTGKTSLIRSLVKEVPKKFVFLPNNMIDMFIDPSFMDFALEDLKNSIIIIEDAENILGSRDQGVNPYVSTILNLTDGLMKDLLNIKIICTINSDINNIDTALLRKGRLLLQSEIQDLVPDKANALLKKLGVDYVTTEPMRLCDIYNMDSQAETSVTKKGIGF